MLPPSASKKRQHKLPRTTKTQNETGTIQINLLPLSTAAAHGNMIDMATARSIDSLDGNSTRHQKSQFYRFKTIIFLLDIPRRHIGHCDPLFPATSNARWLSQHCWQCSAATDSMAYTADTSYGLIGSEILCAAVPSGSCV